VDTVTGGRSFALREEESTKGGGIGFALETVAQDIEVQQQQQQQLTMSCESELKVKRVRNKRMWKTAWPSCRAAASKKEPSHCSEAGEAIER
jgi:hypothetical protein